MKINQYDSLNKLKNDIIIIIRKRPKWQQRATMTPTVLYDLATAVATGVKPALLHADCVDYFKGYGSIAYNYNIVVYAASIFYILAVRVTEML